MSSEISLSITQDEFVFLITMWILSSGQISGDIPITQTAMMLLSDLVDEKADEFMQLRNKMEALSAKFSAGTSSLAVATQLKLALLIDLMETHETTNRPLKTPQSAALPEQALPDDLSDKFRDMFGKGRKFD